MLMKFFCDDVCICEVDGRTVPRIGEKMLLENGVFTITDIGYKIKNYRLSNEIIKVLISMEKGEGNSVDKIACTPKDCRNCKHYNKELNEDPCVYCTSKYNKWEKKVDV